MAVSRRWFTGLVAAGLAAAGAGFAGSGGFDFLGFHHRLVRSRGLNGKKYPVCVLGPGDYFGEMALIDQSCHYRSAKITADTELHCLMFAQWGFRHFAMSHPETAWALLEMMAQRVRDAENR